MEPNDDDDNDSVSKQIREYYKKYSQDRQLPKYFSGTAVQYIPEIVSAAEMAASETSSTVRPPAEESDVKAVSPTSSVASNRKLEWDNGADIGYTTYDSVKEKLQRSVSLPAIIVSTDEEDRTKKESTEPIVTVVSYSSSSEAKSAEAPSTSSSSFYPVEKMPSVVSSSSSSATAKADSSTPSSNFANTIAYLKSRIGTPDAESTPNQEPAICVTPVLQRPRKRKVELCITKPINLECVGAARPADNSNKKTQTSSLEKLSKYVQTSDVALEDANDVVIEPSSNNQSVVVINYDEDEEESGNSDNTRRSTSSQTDNHSGEAIASHCDSFEYLYGSNIQNLRRIEAKHDLATSTPSSNGSPLLGEAISLNVSKDVDKNIGILKKLLKSKRYDAATKKRYVKKIMKRIVESQSTSSSELFVPKQLTNSSEESRGGTQNVQQKLQQNLPWYPVQRAGPVIPLAPPSSTDPPPTLTVKTFSDEYLPVTAGPSCSSPTRQSKKKSIFTIDHPTGGGINSTSSTSTSLEKNRDSNRSYQSWKDDKTLSEQLLEKQSPGKGDQLVKFAMKERQSQIEWINDEISHLSKLKGLLEKNFKRNDTTNRSSDSGGVTKTTTVYMLSSQKYDQSPCSPCSTSNENSSTSGRNYVIQTEIENNRPQLNSLCIDLCDRKAKTNYRVTSNGRHSKRSRYIGDVEFSSDDNTKLTNITVTARKLADFKVRMPTLVGGGQYEYSNTYPRSAQEKMRDDRCQPCGKPKYADLCLPCGMPKRTAACSKIFVDAKSPPTPRRCRPCGRIMTAEDFEYDDSEEVCKPCRIAVCKPCGMPRKDVCQPCGMPRKDVCQPCGKPKRRPRSAESSRSGQGSCKISYRNACLPNCYVAKSATTATSKTECSSGTTQCECAQKFTRTMSCMCKPKAKNACMCQVTQCTLDAKIEKKCQCETMIEKKINLETSCQCEESVQTEVRKKRQKICQTCNCLRESQQQTDCRCKQTTATVQTCCCFNSQTQTEKRKKNNSSCSDSCKSQDMTNVSTTCDDPICSVNKDKCVNTDKCINRDKCVDTCKRVSNDRDTKEVKKHDQSKGIKSSPDRDTKKLEKHDQSSDTESSTDRDTKKLKKYDQGAGTKSSTDRDTKELEKDDQSTSKGSLSESSSSDTSLSTSSESDSTSSTASNTCACCKRRANDTSALGSLRKKLTEGSYNLCTPCYNQRNNYGMAYAYGNPGHICNCYTMVDTRTLDEIKKTIYDIEEVERYCSCVNAASRSKDSKYCKHCDCKLRKSAKHGKNGIAYVLTFEQDSQKKHKKKKKKRKQSLEEIKIKIPMQNKRHKDKENKKKRSGSVTLQEYLMQNRPDFVEVAEHRRRIVADSMEQRQSNKESRKLMLLHNIQVDDLQMLRRSPSPNRDDYDVRDDEVRLFSAKEMREITRKNYQKLPEVQQRLASKKEKLLRHADRIITDRFNRKLRENALKGKLNLAPDVYVL